MAKGHRRQPTRLDRICRTHTIFPNFRAYMVAGSKGTYYPSIRTDLMGPDARLLARAYDLAMKLRGDPRRACFWP